MYLRSVKAHPSPFFSQQLVCSEKSHVLVTSLSSSMGPATYLWGALGQVL